MTDDDESAYAGRMRLRRRIIRPRVYTTEERGRPVTIAFDGAFEFDLGIDDAEELAAALVEVASEARRSKGRQ
ncbi:hypothetical protein H7J50_08975 [Mycobacterium intermedium]|nr:hypothetical protein [Mycobacterium intermedium]MCV6963941.1 hypothetical protein [Mycobacterium intermedium]